MKEKRHATIVGGATILLLALILIAVSQLQIWQPYAYADTSGIDPHTQFCRTYYHIQNGVTNQGAIAQLNACQALDIQFKNYVQSLTVTYGNSSTSTASTPTPVPTTTPTATPTIDSTTPTPTPVPTTNATTPTPTATPTIDATATEVATKNWPTTNLVALVIPADQGKNISDLPAADVKQVEDALTTYFQSHLSTNTPTPDSTTVSTVTPTPTPTPEATIDPTASATAQLNSDQAAISTWMSDPFLQMATVTYSVDATGKATYTGAADSDTTIMPLSNFLQQNAQEVETVQTDIVNSVKSTSYTSDGANCSFPSSATLFQSYQNCLGTGTIVDTIYAEATQQGDTSSAAYTKAITAVENEYAGPIKQYVQAHQSTASGKRALQAYNNISAITDKKLQDTYIDHVLTYTVKVQRVVSTAPRPSPTATGISTPTPTPLTSTPTPTVSATATSTPTSSTSIYIISSGCISFMGHKFCI